MNLDFKGYLFLSVSMCELARVCVFVLFIYTISVSIIYVSREEISVTASNQQIYEFYKRVIFEKKTSWEVNF